ncbi:unnamed protein product [Lactuca virosa]|uniref:Uncharacterized protein n=1 Tax=Lactuca virosa TaxID=75947 RepID=A0AAU9P5C5_9ASTR|nr:unnamed protein product [Lactuca virosa]
MVGRRDGEGSVSVVDEAEEEERRRQRGVGCRSRWIEDGAPLVIGWIEEKKKRENGSSRMWGLPLVSGDKAPILGCLVIEKGSNDSKIGKGSFFLFLFDLAELDRLKWVFEGSSGSPYN